MRNRLEEYTPAVVSNKTKQAGEVRVRWPWTEPKAWTERMLTALEKGVKGGKWFSLIDKVYSPAVLRSAFGCVKANNGAPGVDRQTIEMFEKRLDDNLAHLSSQLQKGTYRPQAIRRTYIPKPGSSEKRPLGIPTVRDRVVQTAVRAVIEPIFEHDFAEQSYGFRPQRGCKDALTLGGWFEYFKHSHWTTFRPLDSWIRMRLRSILRKRSKRKGRGRGRDHQRWTNAYFAKQGLFSLTVAHAKASQSSMR